MKIAYLDCFAGVSGDMLLGAIVDVGVTLKDIEKNLKEIPIKGYRIRKEKVKRSFIDATKVTVIITEKRGTPRKWRDIECIINRTGLPDQIKERGLRVFRGLFEAEGKIHGVSFNEVHLHELGALDCIIDVFGTLIGLHLLSVEKVFSASVNLGSGSIKTEHGIMPIPSPAVIELLKGKPVYSSGPSFELTTPTGAAILREVVNEFRPMPLMNITATGYGAGTMDFKDFPNTLRIILGSQEADRSASQFQGEEVIVIETNIDDMNPQLYEYLFERLFEVGAIDVFLTQVIMKKGRPGIQLTLLCEEKTVDRVVDIIFRETTTLGLRYYRTSRMTLPREMRIGHYGKESIRMKVSRYEELERLNPEYEDCKRIAREKGIPLIDVMRKVK